MESNRREILRFAQNENMKARLLPTAVRCRWEIFQGKESRMSEYIAFDVHKRYTWVDRQDHSTGTTRCHRLEHAPGAVREYLRGCEPGTAVAVEATGNWYWIIDEIEQARLQPRLVHPRTATLMF